MKLYFIESDKRMTLSEKQIRINSLTERIKILEKGPILTQTKRLLTRYRNELKKIEKLMQKVQPTKALIKTNEPINFEHDLQLIEQKLNQTIENFQLSVLDHKMNQESPYTYEELKNIVHTIIRLRIAYEKIITYNPIIESHWTTSNYFIRRARKIWEFLIDGLKEKFEIRRSTKQNYQNTALLELSLLFETPDESLLRFAYNTIDQEAKLRWLRYASHYNSHIGSKDAEWRYDQLHHECQTGLRIYFNIFLTGELSSKGYRYTRHWPLLKDESSSFLDEIRILDTLIRSSTLVSSLKNYDFRLLKIRDLAFDGHEAKQDIVRKLQLDDSLSRELIYTITLEKDENYIRSQLQRFFEALYNSQMTEFYLTKNIWSEVNSEWILIVTRPKVSLPMLIEEREEVKLL